MDVLHVGDQQFLLALAEPLNIVLSAHLPNMKSASVMDATQAHMDLLSSYGFGVRKIFVDPQSSLATMRTKLSGVEVDVSGAGDHLPHLDVRMKVIEEVCRSVHAGLKWV